ncbi:MAG: response regulator [Bacteroidota bacterium]
MGKRICVLEDNRDIREIIELVLHDEKYEVFTFSSVTEFNSKAFGLKADAFLLDVMLPDGSGFDVCCGLKGNEITHDIPVLMMSANFTSTEMNRKCLAEDFISKPFDIFELVKRIEMHVS